MGILYAVLVLVPSAFGPYGLFIDELYYIACSERLALGYVDHPPLSVGLLSLSRAVLGDGQVALRVLPALAGGASVALTGLLARQMGAGAFGQVLAALAVICAPIPTLFFGFYSMNAFEFLLWTAAACVVAEQARTGDGRWWIVLGVVAGVALQNKHTFVLLAIGLATGLLLTPARRAFLDPRLWAGVAIAALILLPNLLWQHANGWPSLEFYANADFEKSVPTPALEVLLQQILFMNPFNALVWGAGIVFLLVQRRGRAWRHLGWAFVVLLALIVASQKSRPDRIAGAYPIALAAGAVVWEAIASRGGWRWVRWVLPAFLVLGAAALAPLSLPILPPESLARYAEATGVVPQIEAGEGKRTRLPQWMADRLDWREFVDQIAGVVEAELAPEERSRALLLVPSYGHLGAIEYYGRGRGLPPVAATQNSCHHWAPKGVRVDVVVAVAYGPSTLGEGFARVERVGETSTTWGTPWRDGLPIHVARAPRGSVWDAWERLRHYE